MALDRIFDVLRISRRSRKEEVIALADRARDARQWQLAAKLYKKALDRNPRNPPIWVQYGHALKESGELRDPERLAQAVALIAGRWLSIRRWPTPTCSSVTF